MEGVYYHLNSKRTRKLNMLHIYTIYIFVLVISLYHIYYFCIPAIHTTGEVLVTSKLARANNAARDLINYILKMLC
jgi:uncharacterized membrane protein